MVEEKLEKRTGFCRNCNNDRVFEPDEEREKNREYKCKICGGKASKYYLDTIEYQNVMRKLCRSTRISARL